MKGCKSEACLACTVRPQVKKNKMVVMEEINKSIMNGTRMLLGIIEAKFLDMKLE